MATPKKVSPIGLERAREIARAKHAFSPEQDNYLIEHRGKLSIMDIARNMGRSEQMVRRRIQHLQAEGKISTELVIVPNLKPTPRVEREACEAVVGEILHAIKQGYDPKYAKRVMEGVKVALRDWPMSEWKAQENRVVKLIVEDMYHYGAE